MAEGDGPSVDVDPGGVELEVADAGEGLGGESLVQLYEVEVVNGQPGAFESLAGGGDRADAHAVGVDAGHGGGDNAGQGPQAHIFGGLFACEQDGRGAVVDAGGV